KEKYEKEVAPLIAGEFKIKNAKAIPRLEKVVVNMGTGSVRDKAKLEQLKVDLAAITGQVPSVRLARLSIAGFNIREGTPVGLKVTLRASRMYNFLTRLFSIVLPRLRDFRGVSRGGFDKNGNYTLGLPEHSVFPEIDITKSGSHGMEITIVTNAKDIKMARRMLELLGMQFEKN
ncbi:50S ribosomal protein L5, partial [Candidatus Woesebacteria bacterium GWB1_43_5]